MVLGLLLLIISVCESANFVYEVSCPPGSCGPGGSFSVNGTSDPEIVCTLGDTITFIIHPNASAHPFGIKNDQSPFGGVFLDNTIVTDIQSTTVNPITNGQLTVTCNAAMQNIEPIFYQCGIHVGMGNKICLNACPLPPPPPDPALISQAKPEPDPTNPWTITSSGGKIDITLVIDEKFIIFQAQIVLAITYNGSYIPPILQLNPGERLRIKIVNLLDDPTNIHFHGFQVTPIPSSSDNVLVEHLPGSSFQYDIPIPVNHPKGLCWYHAHTFGHAWQQVNQGLAGWIIIGDPLSYFPTTFASAVTTRTFNLKDLPLTFNSILGYNTVPLHYPLDTPVTITVNGGVNPSWSIRPNQLQAWYFLNPGPNRFYNLKFAGLTVSEFIRDGRVLAAYNNVTTYLLGPSSRVGFLVVGPASGTYQITTEIINVGEVIYPADNLLKIVSTIGSPSPPVVFPQPCPGFKDSTDLSNKPIAKTVNLNFTQTLDATVFFMDGVTFHPDVVNHKANLGTYEKWILKNGSPFSHLFHIHQTDFQVTNYNGAAAPFVGYQDTVILLPDSTSEIIIPFTNPLTVGKFMVHCHILEHEDAGMMQIIEVVGSSVPTAAPTGSPTLIFSLVLQMMIVILLVL